MQKGIRAEMPNRKGGSGGIRQQTATRKASRSCGVPRWARGGRPAQRGPRAPVMQPIPGVNNPQSRSGGVPVCQGANVGQELPVPWGGKADQGRDLTRQPPGPGARVGVGTQDGTEGSAWMQALPASEFDNKPGARRPSAGGHGGSGMWPDSLGKSGQIRHAGLHSDPGEEGGPKACVQGGHSHQGQKCGKWASEERWPESLADICCHVLPTERNRNKAYQCSRAQWRPGGERHEG